MTTQTSENVKKPPEEFSGIEPLLTIQQAAKELGVHPWALRRAIKSGVVPAYSPFNSRKLVKLSEVVAYIDSCREGGSDER